MDDETSSEVARLLKEVQEKDDEIKDLEATKIALEAKITQFSNPFILSFHSNDMKSSFISAIL